LRRTDRENNPALNPAQQADVTAVKNLALRIVAGPPLDEGVNPRLAWGSSNRLALPLDDPAVGFRIP
jgi:hypothetical protein